MSYTIRCDICGGTFTYGRYTRHLATFKHSASKLPPIRWYADKPAESADISVAGARWLWVDGRGWLSPNEARAAA